MPKSSYAEFIQDWRTLLAAAQAHAADLPDVERHRLALQQQIEAIEAEKARQTEARADRQVKTQALRGMMDTAKDLAKRLRGSVLANVGPKSERLVQFGMSPQRRRPRRADKPTEVPPPEVTPATPAPAGPPRPEPTSTTP